MELFVVNRYDETKSQPSNEQEQEELFLKSLQAKIEKKKKKKVEPVPEIQIEEIPQENQIIEEEVTREIEVEVEEQVPEKEQESEDAIQEPAIEQPEKKSDFLVLGYDHFTKLKKVGVILPPWLSNPTFIDRDLSQKGVKVKKLKYLSENVKENLKKMGFERLFPVQEAVVPWILDAHRKPAPFWPRDVCISSPTGSGKTLAFAIPIVQLLINRVSPAVRALVMLPVQELAEQVANVFQKLCEGTSLKSLLLSKIRPFNMEQMMLLDKFNGKYYPKIDIVITTAGRLVEHLHSTEGFTLSSLRFLVIDEADRVMDQIQNDWLYHLNKNVKSESDEFLIGRASGHLSQTELFDKPRQPHKLLFSATLSQDPEKLQTFKLFHPKLFSVGQIEVPDIPEDTEKMDVVENRGEFMGKYTTPLELKEMICTTAVKLKPLTLFALIMENHFKKFLCFTNGIDGAHRLAFVLQKLFGKEYIIEEWSSSLTPATRKSVLNRFKMGQVHGIICTDALARGIDIDDIDVVISYDMPKHINTYIHRIGRTGRAGKKGTSITILAMDQHRQFSKILSEAGKHNLENIAVQSNVEEKYAAEYAKALSDLQIALDLEKQIINKLRSGRMLSSLNKGNLLGQLKNQELGSDVSSKEIIKSLSYLPKSWTNESIEQRVAIPKLTRKQKRKLNAAAQNGAAKEETKETSESKTTKEEDEPKLAKKQKRKRKDGEAVEAKKLKSEA